MLRISPTSTVHYMAAVSDFPRDSFRPVQTLVLFITRHRQIMINEHIHILYQFAPCYVRHLLLTIIYSLTFLGSIHDRSIARRVSPPRMKWIRSLRSSGSHLSVPRVMSAKRCVYSLPACGILTFHVFQNISIPLPDKLDPSKESLDCPVWKWFGPMSPYMASSGCEFPTYTGSCIWISPPAWRYLEYLRVLLSVSLIILDLPHYR